MADHEMQIGEDVDVAEYDAVAIAEIRAREIVREEIASLCGLVLSRTKDRHPTRLMEHNVAEDVVMETLASIFGEALADFSGHTKDEEPGPA